MDAVEVRPQASGGIQIWKIKRVAPAKRPVGLLSDLCRTFVGQTGGRHGYDGAEAGLVHLRTDLLAQHVNRHLLPIAFERPVGPPVARGRPLQMCADLMDRPFDIIGHKGAIGTDLCLFTTVERVQFLARGAACRARPTGRTARVARRVSRWTHAARPCRTCARHQCAFARPCGISLRARYR